MHVLHPLQGWRHSVLDSRFSVRAIYLAEQCHSKVMCACPSPPSSPCKCAWSPLWWNIVIALPHETERRRSVRIRNKPLEKTNGTETPPTTRRCRNSTCAMHYCTQHESSYRKHRRKKSVSEKQLEGSSHSSCAEHNFREKSLGLREGTHSAVQTAGSELRFLHASSFLWYPEKLSQYSQRSPWLSVPTSYGGNKQGCHAHPSIS